MKLIILIIFMNLITLFCYSQTNTILKKDSTKFFLNQYDYHLFKIHDNNFVPAINYSFGQNNYYHLSRFTLYHDTIYNKCELFDNYRNKDYSEYLYYSNDNIYSSTMHIGAGALNYLILLFEKNNIRIPFEVQTL
jgi:hypothetical protein